MHIKHGSFYLLFLLLAGLEVNGQATAASRRICGKWKSTDNKLIIQVFVKDNEFQAKILWYSDTEGKPLDYWTDVRNPNPALRSRKILGMSVLRNLTYDPETGTWEHGMVYDSRHGREWNAAAYIGKKGLLRVRGYWHFKFIGRTISFKRIQ